ncbi:MAG: iron ABC transporter permease [Paenibacillus macerans]|uniref:FecCD family ABC transporter permease n=1 Tax=Paenibacillus macerans TaxID=44252 RepID=UPI0005621BD2|nr:iron ABC transporter permease [Paenibacillus macerans]MCY7561776.1 iron ABC transporter permease [Paenibacillus macerans]MDU7477390.1 iron ABC transporter permease [Paenibacillus macerans]MEC0139014.1 iron ABC transporter permease [Paenibacillus macerans]MEC0154920.1 iron ABC transporter permease [Paenibacillus macerans]SUA83198.1 transport system permease [Paenibacillus macerans]
MLPLFAQGKSKILGLAALLVLLAAAGAASMIYGRTEITVSTAVEAFKHYDGESTPHIVLRTERLPRTVIAAVVGASLAVAGALMQALTRNPLASPSVFGINAGAIFFIVLASVVLSVSSLNTMMWFGFTGAAIAAAVVYALGSIGRDGLTPIKVVLAGTAITALFSSFTQAVLVLDGTGLQEVLFWLAGSVSGRTLEMLYPVLPYMAAGALAALFMGRAINLLLTGDDIAKGMGQNVVLVKTAMGAATVLLAGGAVAVAGSIGLVGLVVPHIMRTWVGNDYRWLIPYSLIGGAVLLLLADVTARLIILPEELPLGIMTALIGGPFFVYIARKGVTKI